MKIHFIVVLFSVLLFGASCSNQSSVPDQEVNNQKQSNTSQEVETKDSKYHRIEFSEHNGLYRFSAEIPKKFMVENVASIKSIKEIL
mgnify:FL=1